jgi:hypothetical protein
MEWSRFSHFFKDKSLRKLIFNDLSNVKEEIIFKIKLEELEIFKFILIMEKFIF